MQYQALLDELVKRGWVCLESDGSLELLPDALSARYPRVPPAVSDFLRRLERCHNADEDVWLLTSVEFRNTDADTFRWNEYELMALESAEEASPSSSSAIRAFWDQHLPIALAVHSDYDYLAVRVSEPGYGSIVHGSAPDWESPAVVAPSFEAFLEQFTREAAAAEPAFPYNLFL